MADTFKGYLPEQYKDMEMQVVSVNKVNRVLDGINLISGREGTHVSPGIYINDKMMALGMTKAEILAVFYPETDVAKMGEIRRTYRAVKNQTQGAKKK